MSVAISTERPARTGKLWPDAPSALADIVADNQTLAVGGFGLHQRFLPQPKT